MRKLTKLPIPPVLAENADAWLADYKANPTSKTCKYRYRHTDIKRTVKDEAYSKCVYCEGKIGHVSPGDIEHKRPSSKNIDLHFEWTNLTYACTECNRRKNDYDDEQLPFIDPYNDDVESMLCHHGPIVGWAVGCAIAEVSVSKLELNTEVRRELIFHKVEKLLDLNNRLGRYTSETQPVVKELIKENILAMRQKNAEYSAMICSALAKLKFPEDEHVQAGG